MFGYEAVKLYKDHRERMSSGSLEYICEASIEWTVLHIALCAICGIVGGVVGGLLGSGGGFVLGPLLLEIGVIPQVQNVCINFFFLRINYGTQKLIKLSAQHILPLESIVEEFPNMH